MMSKGKARIMLTLVVLYGGAPARNGNSASVPMDLEAKSTANTYWSRLFTFCAAPNSFYTNERGSLDEFKKVTWSVKKTELSEADRLNGITWHGEAILNAPAWRSLGENGSWTDWQTDFSISIWLQKKNGQWALQSTDRFGHPYEAQFGAIPCTEAYAIASRAGKVNLVRNCALGPQKYFPPPPPPAEQPAWMKRIIPKAAKPVPPPSPTRDPNQLTCHGQMRKIGSETWVEGDIFLVIDEKTRFPPFATGYRWENWTDQVREGSVISAECHTGLMEKSDPMARCVADKVEIKEAQ